MTSPIQHPNGRQIGCQAYTTRPYGSGKHADHPSCSHRSRSAAPHSLFNTRAFTLAELLVSIALLIVTMAALSQVFTIASDVTTRTTAHSELLAASAAFRETASDQLSKLSPDGLLIIESPPPAPTPRREVQEGPLFLRPRHDRLVFLTHGDIDEYQSFTDPRRGMPSNTTAAASQALVYFGPGTPLTETDNPLQPRPLANDANLLSRTLTASEWVFLHRSILLMLEDANPDPAVWNPPTMDALAAPGGMLDGGPLRAEFLQGRMDAIVSGNNRVANARSFAQLILGKALDNTDLLSADPSIASLWTPSHAPRSATTNNFNNRDYYTRGGSSFISGLADFRIQWTDGRSIDSLGPDGVAATGDEGGTVWFGLRPDPTFIVNNIAITTGQVPNIAYRRQDFDQPPNTPTPDEAEAFGIAAGSQNRIEWTPTNGADVNAAYRAIWRADTWRFRPKALRFTYRLYDAGNRLKQTTEIDLDEDGDADPDGTAPPAIITRFGRPFSIVVKLP
ncbi:MAG: type II secretion system protein [Phycisphaerae bacterium]